MIFFVTVFSIGQEIKEAHGRAMLVHTRGVAWKALLGKIAAQAGEPMIVLDEEYTTSELLSIVGNLDLLISIRLHGLIFAGVMGVPMVGISYDPKVDRFLRSIGEKPVNDLQDITTASVLKEARRKWAARHEFTAANADLLAQMRTLAARNAELAMGLVRGKS